MPSSPENPTLADLLAHADWMRRLAGHLVRNDAAADDVVQEAWMAVARSPPPVHRVRPWLARVVQNFALIHLRRQDRRRSREKDLAAAQATAPPDSETLLSRMQLQKLVADLVMQLDEPFRSTVLLRFYEGLNASEIARMHRVEAGTVRWRLKVALDRIRAALDQRHRGERRAWTALIVPLIHPPEAAAVMMGVVLMKKKTVAFTVFVVALIGAVAWRAGRRAADVPASATEARSATRPARFEPGLERSTIQGTVAMPDGSAAVGVFVTVLHRRQPAGSRVAPTLLTGIADVKGEFRFRAIEAGQYLVTAVSSRPGVAPSAERPVEVGPGKTASVELALRAGGHTVRGRVLDSGAGTIPGARISAFLARPDPREPSLRFVTSADAAGAYELTLAPGQYALSAEADGYVRGKASVTLAADSTVDLRMEPDAQLVGRVVHKRTREGVPGAEVRAQPVDYYGYNHTAVTTDADGTFRVPGLEAGEWIAEARRGRLVGRARAAFVMQARATGGIVVEVEEAAVVTGRVRSTDGRAVSGVAVAPFIPDIRLGAGATTDADGGFRLEGIAPGSYELSAWTSDGYRGFRDLLVTDHDLSGVEITIAPPIVVEGSVMDSSGIPVAGVRVAVRTVGNERVPSAGRARIELTDANGAFRVVGLPAGELSLTAERQGAGVASWGPESVPPGGSKRVDLRLGDGASLVGRVTEPDGRPASGVTVYVLNSEIKGRISKGSSGPDGRYQVRYLLPGPARAVARRSRMYGFGPNAKPVVLAPDKETTLDLSVARITNLRGRVLFANGQPAAGARILVNNSPEKPASGHPGSAISDAEGAFTFADMDLGTTYHVWADVPGTAGVHESAPAGTQDLVLRFK